ncbi:MAG TPA: 3'(2'),5'-bisphosphate nucleotidase CysQ [Xanthobacteraceae bacterium]|nr:3'(2'),5'-bisphosphate nucleotidase CysQ [Xanthobacteraceae bacterium]HTC06303.1 3'(2'),5'-bisphosphate nucleotidase CysQ [Xanthobacteraceae bacterium]
MPTLDAAACAEMIDALTDIAVLASKAILEVAGSADIRRKDDGSPVTAADEASEAVICAGLKRLAPAVPIVSEEQTDRPQTAASSSYFLVDPLDGTKEFISGRDEYTVNIAVVTGGVPLLGIVAAPAARTAWRGIVGRGAQRLPIVGGTIAPGAIHTRPRPGREFLIMVSRSHLEERTKAYIGQFPHAELVQCGSSVKFCRLAEGAADLYARLAPTHDWDIAAGHAVLVAAGGKVTAPDGAPLAYGSPELLVPAFLAWGDRTPV